MMYAEHLHIYNARISCTHRILPIILLHTVYMPLRRDDKSKIKVRHFLIFIPKVNKCCYTKSSILYLNHIIVQESSQRGDLEKSKVHEFHLHEN